MLMIFKKSRIVLFSILFPGILTAQNADSPIAAGFWGGLTQYNGDLGQGFYKLKPNSNFMHVGGFASFYIQPRIDFSANMTIGKWGYEENSFNKFSATQFQMNGHLRIKLFNDEQFPINPYGLIGIGMAYAGNTDKPGMDIFIPFGVGVKTNVNDRISLFLQETYAYTDHDNRDGFSKNDNDAFLMHSIGISWNLSAPKDSDHDGVTDKNDECPETPAGVRVDTKGCPADRDKDGIADHLDNCPDQKGPASTKGCPDRDKDGIADADDSCPDEQGQASTEKALNGCPDRDQDGLADKNDRCPDEKGSTSMNGCPDTDQDGISNPDDKCPEVAGIAANKGCPEVKEEVKQLFTQALQGIEFEIGKDVIRPVSFPILDNVVRVMNENPAYLLEINGHTDNIGEKSFNLELSQKRADSVKKYLQSKGVVSDRLTSKGFGDSNPVEDNKTAAGRAKNRRVEFKINF